MKAIQRWPGNNKRGAPKRSVPADFRAMVAKQKTPAELCKHYHATEHIVQRWLTDTGLQAWRNCKGKQHRRAVPPEYYEGRGVNARICKYCDMGQRAPDIEPPEVVKLPEGANPDRDMVLEVTSYPREDSLNGYYGNLNAC